MPRDLPISNGNLMINFDRQYNIRDVYYPHVGQDNQTVGDISFFGIWCDGTFAWISAAIWEKTLEYDEETLATRVTATAPSLSLELIISDTVDFDRDLFVRRVEVRNLLGQPRDVRMYLHFDGHLWGNNIGDTVYYEPEHRSLVAYKGHRYVLMNGSVGDSFGFHSFAIGTKERDGFQGTWRDAEDGKLGRNPVAQGSVDSTGMLEFKIASDRTETCWLWWAFGKSYAEVSQLDGLVRERGPGSFHQRTIDYWRLWVNTDGSRDLRQLPVAIRTLYKRSLLILRTQIDDNGAIVAATDSDIVQFGKDTYTYMWPRDGALVTSALIEAGYPEITRKFFTFCTELLTKEGFLLHKYNPDGSVGSSWHPWSTAEGRRQLPIQEDETALVVWAFRKHFEKFHDLEFIQPLYRPLVKNAGEFLLRYREGHTRLPAPSYDLWEERRGIMSFTVGTVWAGLSAAADFTRDFGEHALSAHFRNAAEEIKAAAEKFLFDEKLGRFVRMINVSREGAITIDETLDCSIAGLWQFGMFEPDDSRIVATMDQIIDRLMINNAIGGVARYENDYYHQVSKDVATIPGNPWIICTMWIAEWYAVRATDQGSLQKAIDLLRWACDRALPSGVLAEQIHPLSGEPLSVSPLTWSHAAYVSAVHRVLERMAALGE